MTKARGRGRADPGGSCASAFTAIGTMTTAFFGIRAVSNTAESVVAAPGDQAAGSSRSAPRVTGIDPARGPTAGGAAVIVSGSGFTPDASVRFGDVSVLCRVDSDGRITATCPAGAAGVTDVTVKTAGGLSVATEATRFTFG